MGWFGLLIYLFITTSAATLGHICVVFLVGFFLFLVLLLCLHPLSPSPLHPPIPRLAGSSSSTTALYTVSLNQNVNKGRTSPLTSEPASYVCANFYKIIWNVGLRVQGGLLKKTKKKHM